MLSPVEAGCAGSLNVETKTPKHTNNRLLFNHLIEEDMPNSCVAPYSFIYTLLAVLGKSMCWRVDDLRTFLFQGLILFRTVFKIKWWKTYVEHTAVGLEMFLLAF